MSRMHRFSHLLAADITTGPKQCSSQRLFASCMDRFWRFKHSLTLGLLLVVLISSAHGQAPISGKAVPNLSQLDTIMQSMMTTYSSPGASLSVTVDGRLVFARGYGYARVDTGEFVQPDSLFRIASNSKPITATAILKLIEQGKLSLNTQPFATILNDLVAPAGTTVDPRYSTITIQNLLEHKGGFDDTVLPDPVFAYPDTAATAYGVTAPATPKYLISYMLGKPLQHDPGTTYAYSNLGYLTLGYIIERVSGQNYADYVQANVLAPAKIFRTVPGGNLLSDRLPNEVVYYDYPNAPLAPSVFPPIGSQVPYPYGGWSNQLILANGGWISTPMDLLHMWDSLNGQYSTNILASPSSSYLGYIPPLGVGWEYIFDGSLPGTNSIVHLNTTNAVVGRVVFSFIFNTRSGTNISQPQTDADNAISAFLKTVSSWPSGDLYSVYNQTGTGSSCSFTLASATATAPTAGGTASLAVTDANYCAWSAVSNNSWLHVTGGALNSDSGSVGYTSDANTGASRTGTISVAGQTLTITQPATATSTTLTVSANPTTAAQAQAVVLTATLAPFSAGAATTNGETITFVSGSTTLGTGTLNNGVATLTVFSLPVGTDSLAAFYPGDANFAPVSGTGSIVITAAVKQAATVTLGNLSATYDGTAHAATATTNPAGLSTSLTYNGSATIPVAAGSYTVVATINDASYTGTATGTLVIAKAAATVTLGGLSATYDGTAHGATATSAPTGLSTSLTYGGSATVPTAAGSYAVVATVSDTNYTGTASGTLVIAKATATVSLSNLTFTADGNPHGVTVTTNPAGLSTSVTYAGSAAVPSAAASYAVAATITDPNYTGSATGTLIISTTAVATVTLSNLSATYDGTPHGVVVTTSPASLPVSVTYNGSATVPTAAGSYAVVATITDVNHPGSGTGTLVIAKATASVTLSNLSATADGSPHGATVTTVPAGLSTTVTYAGLATVPSVAGSYAVVATIADPNYTGSATATLTITTGVKQVATVTLGTLSATYDGTAHGTTATTNPAGLSTSLTYNGSATAPVAAGSYTVVATVNDASYTGTATGTLVIAKATATVTLGGLSAIFTGNPQPVTTTTSPTGLAVSVLYAGSSTVPTAVGSYAVVATITDPNYTGTGSGTLVIAASTSQDFSFATSGSTAQTVVPGQTVSYTFAVSSLTGAYGVPVSFAATGLPAGAVVTFTPSSVASGTKQVVMSVTAPVAVTVRNENAPDRRGYRLPPITLGFLLVPLALRRRILATRKGMLPALLLVIAMFAGATILSGCGSGVFLQQEKAYNATVTATSGSYQHSISVTLNVQ